MTGFAMEAEGSNRWKMNAADGLNVSARLRDGWICCETAVSLVCAPAALLERNATLPGPLKYAPDGAGGVCLRAEAPVPNDGDADAVLHFLAESYAQHSGAERPGVADTMDAETLAVLCEQAGWAATIRGMECRAPLAFEDRRAAVRVTDGGVCASVEVMPPIPAGGACAAAVALLLFRAGGAVRLVRPVLVDGVARFEAFVGGPVCAEQIDAALSALSVALEECAIEAEALGCGEALATEYLANGGSAAPGITTNTTTTTTTTP